MSEAEMTPEQPRERLLYIVDWLPPDFGAIGQYALQHCVERAQAGWDVVLAGLSSEKTSEEVQQFEGGGTLRIRRLKAQAFDRNSFIKRAIWTFRTNARLLWHNRRELAWTKRVLITGSPPFLIHFMAPLNRGMGKSLTYRIADFHPECLMAGVDRVPLVLTLFHRLTLAMRKSVQHFEVLGEDQRERLIEAGIDAERIELERCPSPVEIDPNAKPLDRPSELKDHAVLLYSGNFGRAHDYETFLEGYRLHHERAKQSGKRSTALWLNAIGAHAAIVEERIKAMDLPLVRGQPVPLNQLANLMVTPDAHLITLLDEFVGYVVPSKVYACIESGRPVLYVGSKKSDVHLLCSQDVKRYWQAETGNAASVADALDAIAAGQ